MACYLLNSILCCSFSWMLMRQRKFKQKRVFNEHILRSHAWHIWMYLSNRIPTYGGLRTCREYYRCYPTYYSIQRYILCLPRILWRHQMETVSLLLALCAGNFPGHRSFDVFFENAWTNGWLNNRCASDLRRHGADYDITVMICHIFRPRRRAMSVYY